MFRLARKRMIDPTIWQSEDFGKLSYLAKIVFIGLFSLADDEGRGRANPIYLKNTLFPYDETIKSSEIDKALYEISAIMSIVFYSVDNNQYYELYSWNKFQTINRPSKSQIPQYIDGDSDTIQRTFSEYSVNVHGGLTPNRKEKKRREEKEKENTHPTLEEINSYILEKGLNVDGKFFYEYFTEGNWVDSKGNKVKNWKQKLLTWSKQEKPKQQAPPIGNYSTTLPSRDSLEEQLKKNMGQERIDDW